MVSDRKSRFKKLASHRTNQVLDKLRLIGNLSNKSNYEYTDDDVKKIFSAIDKQIRIVRAKFHTSRKRGDFRL